MEQMWLLCYNSANCKSGGNVLKSKIVIAGLGLIGGSLAKAFHKLNDFSVVGFDSSEEAINAALSCGAIEKAGTDDDIRQAGMIFLCMYPEGCINFVEKHLSAIRSGCLVTDTCGIKSWLCPRMEKLAEKSGFIFVGSHPMAGKETSGFASSDAGLFRGASWILVPCGAPREAVERLKLLAPKLGFACTVETTPEGHDRMIAFTSQLPHVLACAYVMSPQCPGHSGFSAGSYHDVSRVAHINEDMWTELFLENSEALTEELDTFTTHIGEMRNAIASRDAATLRRLLRRSRLVKEGLGE